jgi:hypothetical protein
MKVNFKGFYNDQIEGLFWADRYFRLVFTGRFEGVNLPAMVNLFIMNLSAEDSVLLEIRFTKDGIFTELNFEIILRGREAKCFLDKFLGIVPPDCTISVIEVEVKENVEVTENQDTENQD